jgi:outer membrane protein
VTEARERHPDILKLDNKIRELDLEERFRRASLQPQLAATASLISATPTPDVKYDWSSYYSFQPKNYKIGVDLVYPIFLRKERGKLREVQIKNRQTALNRQQSGRDVVNRVKIAYNQVRALSSQISTQNQVITNQGILVRGELEKFDLGESSLFLVNSRETKLIDLRIKGEELRAKYQQAIAELYYVTGTIGGMNN